jgi:hypothetical protein
MPSDHRRGASANASTAVAARYCRCRQLAVAARFRQCLSSPARRAFADAVSLAPAPRES